MLAILIAAVWLGLIVILLAVCRAAALDELGGVAPAEPAEGAASLEASTGR